MTLPHNIERRLFAGSAPWATYRGWDALGRVWIIAGSSGGWHAYPIGHGAHSAVYAPTLDRMSAKLATIGKQEAA